MMHGDDEQSQGPFQIAGIDAQVSPGHDDQVKPRPSPDVYRGPDWLLTYSRRCDTFARTMLVLLAAVPVFVAYLQVGDVLAGMCLVGSLGAVVLGGAKDRRVTRKLASADQARIEAVELSGQSSGDTYLDVLAARELDRQRRRTGPRALFLVAWILLLATVAVVVAAEASAWWALSFVPAVALVMPEALWGVFYRPKIALDRLLSQVPIDL